MDTPRPVEEIDLREYLRVLRRRKWTIFLTTVVVTAAALAFSFRQTPIYASTAKLQVKPPVSSLLQNVNVAALVSMDTEKALAASTSVADIAAQDLPNAPVLGHLSVSVPTDSQILEITYSDPDPVTAQRTAQAFADAYLAFKQQQAIDTYTRVRSGIFDQIGKLQARLNDARLAFNQAVPDSTEQQKAQSDMDLLTGQIALLRNQVGTLSVLDLDPGTIIQPADLPTSPASPNHVLNGLLGLFVGLGLGVGLAFLRERLDDQLKGREEMEEAIGAPALAIVPSVPGWKKRDRTQIVALEGASSPLAEAYRTIRTNLAFIARDGRVKVLIVTSPSMGDGKTTTVANLAVVLAQAGKRVIAVSADLRKPRLHRFFDLENRTGITNVLSGQAPLSDCVLRVEGLKTLRLLPSGPVPPNPAELLGSEEMQVLLGQLRDAADFVLVDSAPVLAVSDALALAPMSDGVLIVADAANTTRDALAHTREQLEQVDAHIVGGILNNLDQSRAKYYPSYYRHYYAYRHHQEPEVETGANGKQRGATLDVEELWR
jgi:polysaccharide biosynthesis transport protein